MEGEGEEEEGGGVGGIGLFGWVGKWVGGRGRGG